MDHADLPLGLIVTLDTDTYQLKRNEQRAEQEQIAYAIMITSILGSCVYAWKHNIKILICYCPCEHPGLCPVRHRAPWHSSTGNETFLPFRFLYIMGDGVGNERGSPRNDGGSSPEQGVNGGKDEEDEGWRVCWRCATGYGYCWYGQTEQWGWGWGCEVGEYGMAYGHGDVGVEG